MREHRFRKRLTIASINSYSGNYCEISWSQGFVRLEIQNRVTPWCQVHGEIGSNSATDDTEVLVTEATIYY